MISVRRITRNIIEDIQINTPEVLVETKREETSITLDDVNAMTPPSQMKKLKEDIMRRRETGEGLTDEELQRMMSRLKH